MHVWLVHVILLHFLQHFPVNRQRFVCALLVGLPQDVSQTGVAKHHDGNSEDDNSCGPIHAWPFCSSRLTLTQDYRQITTVYTDLCFDAPGTEKDTSRFP